MEVVVVDGRDIGIGNDNEGEVAEGLDPVG